MLSYQCLFKSPVSAGAIQAFAGIALIHLATERGGTALVYGGTPGIAAGTWLLAVGIGLLSAAALGLGLRRERLRAGLLPVRPAVRQCAAKPERRFRRRPESGVGGNARRLQTGAGPGRPRGSFDGAV